jgi:hypothetical protein
MDFAVPLGQLAQISTLAIFALMAAAQIGVSADILFIAITCLARRRCDVIHAMLRSGLTYGELPGPATPAPEPDIALAA